jgi:ParB/RepB/Spo0J family partition protein
MQIRHCSVPLDRIHWADQTYRITTQKDTRRLSRSIGAVGLLSPPLLIERKTVYQIICGFRRITACFQLGWRHMDARVLDPNTCRLDRMKMAIADNSGQRPLNILEQANALQLIKSEAGSSQCADIARSIGIEGNTAFFEKLQELKRLPEPIQEAVLDGVIPLSIVNLLKAFDSDTSELLASIFQQLKLGLNKQREVIETVKEISIRDGLSACQLLSSQEITNILDSEHLDRNQKTHQLRQLLRQKRFPTLVAAEKRFNQQVGDIKLGDGIKLEAPRYFESRAFSFHIHFQNVAELKQLLGRLQQVAESSVFQRAIGFKNEQGSGI